MTLRQSLTMFCLALCLVVAGVIDTYAATVKLSWVAPTTDAKNNSLQDLAGYKVYVGQASRSYGSPTDVGNETSHTLTGLTAGQRYYAAVTAYDTSSNESAYSTEVNFLAPSDAPPPPSAPVANFSASPTSGLAPLTVSFSDTSTGNITAWSWDFGDGSTSTTRQPTHVYANPGTYSVRLRVTGPGGSNSAYRANLIAVSQPNPSPSGLVAAYGFNEGSGNTLNDSSGQGNHGTISGATWSNSGRYGKALVFNGTNAWVTIPDSASLDLTSGMTLEAWIYPTALSGGTPAGWRQVLLKEQPNQLVYSLIANTDGNRPAAYVYTNSDIGVTGTAQVPLNQWTFLAATYNGASLRLYVNGGLVASTALSGTIRTSSGPLRIGGNSIWGEYFAGRIDEVRVYNRALSTAEIQADQNRAVGATTSGMALSRHLPSPQKLRKFLAERSRAASAGESRPDVTRLPGSTPRPGDSSPARMPTTALSSPLVDIGEATVDHRWQRIAFTQSFQDPVVVVANTLSYRDATPAVVSLSQLDQHGFAVRLLASDPSQGTHAAESIPYVVMEKGRFTLAEGAQVESGVVEIDTTHPEVALSFSRPFRLPPVVLTSVSTGADVGAIVGGPVNIGTAGFQFHMQESALPPGDDSTPSTLSYIAWEPSAGAIEGLVFEVGTQAAVDAQQFQAIRFGQAFPQAPVFLAEIQSKHSLLASAVRWEHKAATGIEIKLDQGRSAEATGSQRGAIIGYISLR